MNMLYTYSHIESLKGINLFVLWTWIGSSQIIAQYYQFIRLGFEVMV